MIPTNQKMMTDGGINLRLVMSAREVFILHLILGHPTIRRREREGGGGYI